MLVTENTAQVGAKVMANATTDMKTCSRCKDTPVDDIVFDIMGKWFCFNCAVEKGHVKKCSVCDNYARRSEMMFVRFVGSRCEYCNRNKQALESAQIDVIEEAVMQKAAIEVLTK